MKLNHVVLLVLCLLLGVQVHSVNRVKYNFNSDWLLQVGDIPQAQLVDFDDASWQRVTLPRAFNEDEAFRIPCHDFASISTWMMCRARNISWSLKECALAQSSSSTAIASACRRTA